MGHAPIGAVDQPQVRQAPRGVVVVGAATEDHHEDCTGVRSEVAANVRAALARDPVVGSFEIDVEVKNQEAHLRGTVDSSFEKGQAEDVVARPNGVAEVRNRLQVEFTDAVTYEPYVSDWSIYLYPWYRPHALISHRPDSEIRRDIQGELYWSPFVDAEEIEVKVESGIATLAGTVDSWREHEAARESAYQGGALRVINKLKVE